MTHCVQVTSVSYLGGRRLEVVFDDGLVRQLDFYADWFGNLEQLNQDDFFAQVSIDPVAQTLCWPNGIDLDPQVLHGEHEPVSGAYFTVVNEYKLIRG